MHLGQDDLPLDIARRLLGPNRILGLSTHTIHQVINAQHQACDYIGFGPIFQSKNKPNKKALGLKLLEQACISSKKIIFALGGISIDNIDNILNVNCNHIAVIDEIMSNSDPTTKIKDLKYFFKKFQ